MSGPITVLCSGFGLGFYIPGLLIERKLARMGLPVDVEVFENVMPEAKRQKVDENRKAYGASFKVALASQKMPGDIRQSLDPDAVETLIRKWLREDRKRFVCLSGHWVHVLDSYRERRGDDEATADLLHVDSEPSPSWKQLRKLKPDYAAAYRETGLYDPQENRVLYRIETDGSEPVPFGRREESLVLHGGGWGIGTFREKAEELASAGFRLDIVAYDPAEAAEPAEGRRYCMNDPDWRAWSRDGFGRHVFPPFAAFRSAADGAVFEPQPSCHGLYGVIRRAKAVVSKPGAGALIDSLASATPLVLLEPFGEHERKNAEIWESLGYGIGFEAWKAAGFAEAELERLHRNLVAGRAKLPDYASEYAEASAKIAGRRG